MFSLFFLFYLLLISFLFQCLLSSYIWISITDHMIKDLSVIRRGAEEHFERCMHALEARHHTLLTYLNQIAQYQGMFIFPTYHICSRLSHLSPLTSHLSPLTNESHPLDDHLQYTRRYLIPAPLSSLSSSLLHPPLLLRRQLLHTLSLSPLSFSFIHKVFFFFFFFD